jgi:hypothetical protein
MDVIAVLAAIVALALASAALVSVTRSERRAVDLAPGAGRNTELERHLLQLGQRIDVLESDVDAQRSGAVADARPTSNALRGTGAAITHIGLVRFDAFDDTGGEQSFALAMLDDDADGIVLTSLHSRPTTRVYVKGVRGGVADAPLSAEERRALQEAGLTL